MKKITFLLLALCNSMVFAELKPMDNQTLRAIEGQAGADLSLKLTLNQKVLTNTELANGTAPIVDCANLAYCHLAISPNKRFVQKDASGNWTVAASDPTVSNPGHKLWLVFKGIQGTMNIQKLGLDGIDLQYSNMIKPAIQLTVSADKPLQIRNYGFNALSIEQDNFTSYYDATGKLVEGSSSTASDYGYLKANVYSDKAQVIDQSAPTLGPIGTTADKYDTGRETGFVGMMMNGNLALQGKIMMFSCDGNHPRC
ncbi:hypothetical protein [Acinetobacter sp. ANC 4648]|uniref:hypothetical protein n=1 Tax=Acinetobacter sp. ANC 4648 TaxID=1977875 RepID=UPI000A34A0C2|nr:hypothetical protein [Acinetobacter sp. ANC 4648]OTG83833.1 hypothetical protein B9T27_04875 [Acinetobacter sp. ANC 4648]